jgi:hypothetical protein
MFKSLDFENLKRKVLLNTTFVLFIYHYMQIYKLAFTFKKLIFSYRKQPHCKRQVFRSVYVCHLVFECMMIIFFFRACESRGL